MGLPDKSYMLERFSNLFLTMSFQAHKFKTPKSLIVGQSVSTLLAQLLLNCLLDFYETLHICSTIPADVHE